MKTWNMTKQNNFVQIHIICISCNAVSPLYDSVHVLDCAFHFHQQGLKVTHGYTCAIEETPSLRPSEIFY